MSVEFESLPEARELLAEGTKAIGPEVKGRVYVGASPAHVLTPAAGHARRIRAAAGTSANV